MIAGKNHYSLQPSVRGLYTALASLKHKLDNIMPTLSNSEEAVAAARRYLAERLGDRAPAAAAAERGFRKGRRDSNTSVASTLSQLGEHMIYYLAQRVTIQNLDGI